MTIQFVTTFSKDLYYATGVKLIESFCQTHNQQTLLCCYEGFRLKPETNRLQTYNLEHNTLLLSFLQNNQDVIPDYLGGHAKHCTCKDWQIRHSKYHIAGCHYHWMNRNASRWFRKVIALDYAVKEFPSAYLVWVDCDSEFLKLIDLEFVQALSKDVAFVYCKGIKREAIEAGVMIFNLNTGGREIIQKVLDKYMTRNYLKYHRWDDGFILTKVVEENPKIICKDLITEIHPNPRYQQEVLAISPFAKYIRHNKGSHGRKLNIMR